MEKWRVFALRAASSLILRGGRGGGFIVPFYFVQDCSLYTDASFPKKKMGERDFFFEERGGCTQAGVYWTWLLSAQCNGEQYPLANARMH